MVAKKYILMLFVFSFVFGRTSNEHQIVIAPDALFTFQSANGVVFSKDLIDDDRSIKWKRRHKRRKKSRRPQRGR